MTTEKGEPINYLWIIDRAKTLLKPLVEGPAIESLTELEANNLRLALETLSRSWEVRSMETEYLVRITLARSALTELRRKGRSGWKILKEPENIEKAIEVFSKSSYIGLYPLGYGSVGLMDYILTGNTDKILALELREAVQDVVRQAVDGMRGLAGGALFFDGAHIQIRHRDEEDDGE